MYSKMIMFFKILEIVILIKYSIVFDMYNVVYVICLFLLFLKSVNNF